MYKIVLLLTVLFVCSNRCFSSAILDMPKVDERVELLSIVFRLAECDEYTSDKNTAYVSRIHAHFNGYRQHPLINYVKKIRSHNGIGYDAVMQMAVHIGNAPDFTPVVAFDKDIPEHRWGKKTALKFLQLLRRFYTDAHCAAFFQEQQRYYTQVTNAFLPNYEKLDLNWYTQFYGNEPEEEFIILIAPGNGGNNYGPHITTQQGEKKIYAILGTWDFDQNGNCIFPTEEYFPVLLHEFNHSFVNPLIEAHNDLFTTSCNTLFEKVAIEMNNQAYGEWQVMCMESIVRAAVISYMTDHGFDSQLIEAEKQAQFYKGFLWINDLASCLQTYSMNRSAYPSFSTYIQEIAHAFSGFTAKLPEYEKLYNEGRPRITSIEEFENGATSVDASTKTITIHFNMEMKGYGYSINYGSLGKKHYPEITKIRYAPDNRSVILEVQLACDQEYQLVLLGKGFSSKQKVPIKDYEIRFRTKKCS